MEIGIQALGAGFGQLLRLSGSRVVQEPPQLDAGVKGSQLLLVQVQHLVHPALILELRTNPNELCIRTKQSRA